MFVQWMCHSWHCVCNGLTFFFFFLLSLTPFSPILFLEGKVCLICHSSFLFFFACSLAATLQLTLIFSLLLLSPLFLLLWKGHSDPFRCSIILHIYIKIFIVFLNGFWIYYSNWDCYFTESYSFDRESYITNLHYSNGEYYITMVDYLTDQYYLDHDHIKLVNWEFIILVLVRLK